jgi:hypothetical protein
MSYFGTQYCDIAIKRHFEQNTTQGMLCFYNSLPWLSLKSMAQKYLFFIAISFYRNIVSRVNKALDCQNTWNTL